MQAMGCYATEFRGLLHSVTLISVSKCTEWVNYFLSVIVAR